MTDKLLGPHSVIEPTMYSCKKTNCDSLLVIARRKGWCVPICANV